jgi:excisionase family DNA binding protein
MKLGDLPDVLTAEVLSKFLSLSKRRVYELMELKDDAGGIPCLRIGRSKRVLKTDLLAWLEKSRG